MIRFFHNDVDHIINGNPAEDFPGVIHNGCRYPIITFKTTRYLCCWHVYVKRFLIGNHHFSHRHGRIRDEDSANRKETNQFVAAINDNQVVGVWRYLDMASQVSEDNIQSQIRPNGDDVGAH